MDRNEGGRGGSTKTEERGESLVYMWGYLPGVSSEKSPILSLSPVQFPNRMDGGDSWKDVCGGGCGFAMAISECGKLMTWGSTDDEGQSYVVSGKHGETPEPYRLPNQASILKVAAGWAHCVSVTDAGALLTFGWGLYGQIPGSATGQRLHQWEEHEEDEFSCQQIDGPQSSEEWFVIQTPQCAASYEYMQEDIRIEEPPGEDYSPMEENGNLEISPDSVPSYVHRPHIPFHDVAKQPTKLQDCIDTDGLDRNAYTKSASGKSHGQIVHTIILDTRQDTDINVFEVVTVPAPAQPIALEESHVEFYEKAPADPESPTEPLAAQVYMPHIPNPETAKQPTEPHECIETDELHRLVHNKSESGKSHGRHLETVTLDTRQAATDENVLAAFTDTAQ